MAMTARAQAPSPQLATVLKQMDTASKSFRGATANFRWDYYQKIVHDTSTQEGSIYFQRDGATVDMGAVIATPQAGGKGKPAVQNIVQYKGGELQMLDPAADQITVLHAGANQAEYESFLTLGFGGSGADLERLWSIADEGPETLTDDGQPVKTEKLDLVSKDDATRKSIQHVTIWVDPARAISLKQIFYQTGGNTRTAVYSHIRLTDRIDKSKFEIKRNSKTTVVNR